MTPDELLSPVEHRIFFGIAFLICCLFFANLADITVAAYNEDVEKAQIEKRDEANKKEKISFAACTFGGPPAYTVILGLQLFTNPLLLLLFLKRTRPRFIFSVPLAAFTFCGYASWMSHSYSAIKHGAFIDAEKTTFNAFLLYNSTVSEFILFLLFAVLLVLQFAVLTRFIIGKFQARIYLR